MSSILIYHRNKQVVLSVKQCLRAGTLAVLLSFAGISLAADLERGRMLYINHCTECHESVVHVREDHRVHSLAELQYQIARWAYELKLDWQVQEMVDVLDYLNDRYYDFSARE